MCSRLKESGVRTRPGTSGMGGTLPRADRSVHHAGAASLGPDQAQEQARSGGRVRHTTGDGTLRLIEKASSCRQRKGHHGVNTRGRPGRQLPQEEK